MAGYDGLIAHMTALDTRIRAWDPDWQSLSQDLLSLTSSATSGADFAGVLAGISDASGANGSLANMAADSISTNPWANTIYSGIRVLNQGTNDDLSFGSPLPGSTQTQAFGATDFTMEPPATVNGVHYAHYHPGLDLATRMGTPVLAAAAGTVISAGRDSTGAVVVRIRHDDGYVSLYGHLDPNLPVEVGDRVAKGQEIGKEGMTGKTTGPHLHFGLYTRGGQAIDPSTYLKSGRLPDLTTLASPSATDPGATENEPASAVLARFDAVSSKIPYAAQIRSAAIAAGIDPLLLASLVSAESNFHPNDVSSCGARGLTQLMPAIASGMHVADVFNPQQNLDGGARYLALQLHRFGRVDMALAAYNKGPGTVGRVGGVPASATYYVNKILGKWRTYEDMAS